MQPPTPSLQKTDGNDTPFKAELPERGSTYFTHQKSPVSPQSNRISSPGLESLKFHPDPELESPIVVETSEKEAYYTPDSDHSAPELHEWPPSRLKKPKKLLFWTVAVLACVAIGLGVGLGVGFTRRER